MLTTFIGKGKQERISDTVEGKMELKLQLAKTT